MDGGQIFEHHIADELKLFVVFALVVLVYLGSQRPQDVLHAQVLQDVEVDLYFPFFLLFLHQYLLLHCSWLWERHGVVEQGLTERRLVENLLRCGKIVFGDE